MFVFCSLVFSYIGRKIGWALSKLLMYKSPVYFCVGLCLLWGTLVAVAIQALIVWRDPGTILKWIFGYLLGCYVAIPNFGLFQEPTIPREIRGRHLLISCLPEVTYIVITVLFGIGVASLG